MFCVVFEVRPRPEQWDAYLEQARLLRPELERIDGFIDNIRYRSQRRPGWVLSLSTWRDEKSLIRWRTQSAHHLAQERGRGEILDDYRLRVGEVTADSALPAGAALRQDRLDATEVGTPTICLVQGEKIAETAEDAATRCGLSDLPGLADWDVFDAILTPGEGVLLASWTDPAAAAAFAPPPGARLRRLRVIRDYGLRDRREAPQFYPDAAR